MSAMARLGRTTAGGQGVSSPPQPSAGASVHERAPRRLPHLRLGRGPRHGAGHDDPCGLRRRGHQGGTPHRRPAPRHALGAHVAAGQVAADCGLRRSGRTRRLAHRHPANRGRRGHDAAQGAPAATGFGLRSPRRRAAGPHLRRRVRVWRGRAVPGLPAGGAGGGGEVRPHDEPRRHRPTRRALLRGIAGGDPCRLAGGGGGASGQPLEAALDGPGRGVRHVAHAWLARLRHRRPASGTSARAGPHSHAAGADRSAHHAATHLLSRGPRRGRPVAPVRQPAPAPAQELPRRRRHRRPGRRRAHGGRRWFGAVPGCDAAPHRNEAGQRMDGHLHPQWRRGRSPIPNHPSGAA